MGPCGPAPQQGKPRCIAAFRTFLERFWLNLGVVFVHFSNLHFWLKSLEGPRGAGLKTVMGWAETVEGGGPAASLPCILLAFQCRGVDVGAVGCELWNDTAKRCWNGASRRG